MTAPSSECRRPPPPIVENVDAAGYVSRYKDSCCNSSVHGIYPATRFIFFLLVLFRETMLRSLVGSSSVCRRLYQRSVPCRQTSASGMIFRRNINGGGIADFVDGRKNEDGDPIPVGRSWKASELRLKSFEDLQKLWFVLLKERNMLHTEKLLAKRNGEIMKGFSRFKKVKVSMARLKTVVNERTRDHKKQLGIDVQQDRNTKKPVMRYVARKRRAQSIRQSHAHKMAQLQES